MVSRYLSSVSSRPLHVCIVGSGPAGLYTADKVHLVNQILRFISRQLTGNLMASNQVLKAHEGAHVDIIDRLPTPFGLVRSGVAPDHPETKVPLLSRNLV